jgi:hypothetical protein
LRTFVIAVLVLLAGSAFAQMQLENEELDDLERTFNAWQKAFKKPSPAIEDFRAGNPAVSRMNISWRADVTLIDGQTLTGGDTATLFATETRLGVRAEEQTTEPAGVKVQIDALNPEEEKEDGILVRADLLHVTTKTVKEQLAPFVYRYRNRPQAM